LIITVIIQPDGVAIKVAEHLGILRRKLGFVRRSPDEPAGPTSLPPTGDEEEVLRTEEQASTPQPQSASTQA